MATCVCINSAFDPEETETPSTKSPLPIHKEMELEPMELLSKKEEPEKKIPWTTINIFNFYNHVPQLRPALLFIKKEKTKRKVRLCVWLLILCLYLIFFVAALSSPNTFENKDYWCDGEGLLIIFTVFGGILVAYFMILKPLCQNRKWGVLKKIYDRYKTFTNYRRVRLVKYLVLIGVSSALLVIDASGDYQRLHSALGGVALLLIAALFSLYPTQIHLNQIAWGVCIQIIFGLIILRWPVGNQFFDCVSGKITVFLNYNEVGSIFTFGDFLNSTNSYAFKILTVILYFGMFVSILYYYGILQWIIIKLGWLLEISMGTTPCESMAAAANIFLGQSEAPLVIRPYVKSLTLSELHTVTTSGFATVAGGIFAAYVSFGVDASHLLSASIMSAPAALAMSKLFYPETETSVTKSECITIEKTEANNVIHAIIIDLKNNIPLIANIAGVIMISISTTSFLNAVLNWLCQTLGYDDGTCEVQTFLGYLLCPVAWLMGIPTRDCYYVGYLLGMKIFTTEFIAYIELMKMFREGILLPRSVVISTYALCGFSNIASMGCQIGALGCICPSRLKDISSIIFRSFVAGNFACFLTACVAGALIAEPSIRLATLNATLPLS